MAIERIFKVLSVFENSSNTFLFGKRSRRSMEYSMHHFLKKKLSQGYKTIANVSNEFLIRG